MVSSGKYREFYAELHTPKKKNKKKNESVEVSSSSDDSFIELQDEDNDVSDAESMDVTTGSYVIVKYNEEYYPGEFSYLL